MRRLGLAVIAILAAACATTIPGSPSAATAPPAASPSQQQPAFSVANGTTISVVIAVNGAVLETVPAGATEDPVRAALPPRPWTVEARSPSGRVLATMTVSAADPLSATSGRVAIEDLACGRLALWAGAPFAGGPSAIPDPAKPCD